MLYYRTQLGIIQQPPYSPELNPVEHIWDEIREKSLHNKAFDNLTKTINAVCKGIQHLSKKTEYIKKMTSFKHLNVIL